MPCETPILVGSSSACLSNAALRTCTLQCQIFLRLRLVLRRNFLEPREYQHAVRFIVMVWPFLCRRLVHVHLEAAHRTGLQSRACSTRAYLHFVSDRDGLAFSVLEAGACALVSRRTEQVSSHAHARHAHSCTLCLIVMVWPFLCWRLVRVHLEAVHRKCVDSHPWLQELDNVSLSCSFLHAVAHTYEHMFCTSTCSSPVCVACVLWGIFM